MRKAIPLLLAAVLLASGCTSYYKVHDPTTGKTYYTSDLKRKSSGAAELVDGRTGNHVSLQNSEVSQITKEEYDVKRFDNADSSKSSGSSMK